MKNKRRPLDKTPSQAAAVEIGAGSESGIAWWIYAAGVFLCLFTAFEIYQPVLNAPFLFDDLYLPFTDPAFANRPLSGWISLNRPLLTATYWLNYRTSGMEPLTYHIWNVLLHAGTSLFVWLITRNLLERVDEGGWKREILAAFAGAVFLVHPLQTESVAYVASRSETLSVLFAFAALYVYLSRPSDAIGLGRAGLALSLAAAAAASKEHAVVMPAAFVLADLYWSRRAGLKAIAGNWKFYAPLAGVGAAGAYVVWRILSISGTAGFSVREMTWYQYLFTQARAIWVYIRMFFLPYGQSIDHDFPISRSVLDHGAILGLFGLLGLAALAWLGRNRFRLASFGVCLFLLLLAPTSSIVPIRDVLVERRMYLPLLGLLLAVIGLLRAVRIRNSQLAGMCAGVLCVLGYLTYARNVVWSNPISLWQDTTDKSPAKPRPRFQLAFALYSAGQCGKAVQQYERAASLGPPDTALLVDWAMALDCNGDLSAAGDKLQQAAALGKTAYVYSLLGMIHAKQGDIKEAWAALDEAVKIDPNFDTAHLYRGNLHLVEKNLPLAEMEYRKAVELNPASDAAKQALAKVQDALSAQPGRMP